jgi:hypothetical protein
MQDHRLTAPFASSHAAICDGCGFALGAAAGSGEQNAPIAAFIVVSVIV